MQKEVFYNPFIYLAGKKSLIIGLIFILLLSFACFLSGIHNLGLLHVHYAKDLPFEYFLIEHFAYWIIISCCLMIWGSVFSRSRIRFVDVCGTQSVARLPLIILPLIRFVPIFASMSGDSISLEILYWTHLFLIGWTVFLMLNAYKVACNLKEYKLFGTFIISLILSEILTKFLITSIT